ncbi:MAG: response regulator, partial [bacterium]
DILTNGMTTEREGPLLDVTAILKTSDEMIWIGTSDGLYSIQSHQMSYRLLKYPDFPAVNIWSLAAGWPGYLWIGTYGQGLFRLQIDSGKIEHWMENPKSPTSLGNNYIRALHQDKEGYVWIGSWGRGLNRFHPETGEWRQYLHNRDDPSSLSYNDIWSIYEDQFNNLWIGTKGGGLNLLDRRTQTFRRWQNNSPVGQRISHNGILTLKESFKDIISSEQDTLASFWIGTENGLDLFIYSPHRIDISSTRILSFSEKNGLPSNVIKSIEEDEQGNLWLGTNLGLAKVQMGQGFSLDSLEDINLDSKQFLVLHYTTKDGLPSNDFSSHAVCMAQPEEYFWGNSGGLLSFKSSQLRENPFSVPVVISEFYVQNNEISGKFFNFPDNIRPDTTLLLNHTQNFVSFRFSALDFRAPRECRFTYRLLGFNEQWIEAGNRRFVSYTNLSPGQYTFQVKGTNSNGVWNEQATTLSFIVSPPWWRTNWAYLTSIFIIGSIIWFARRYELNRFRLKHQLALQTFKTRKFQELEQIKSRFFANLSHEFRTPLMLISGPVEQLRKGLYKGNEKKAYDLILRNTHRLLELIEQLLALSQLEAGSLPLRATEEFLVPLLRGLVFSFESLANKKGITLTLTSADENVKAWIDQDKFEKIIGNLLSNALKFTPEGGTVKVHIAAEGANTQMRNEVEISVTDSGIGISQEHQNHIFDRFYQVDDSSQRSFGGSGIGLALVKELVDLHHWKIRLESDTGKGSTFTLMIPLGNSHLNEDEMGSAKNLSEKSFPDEIAPSHLSRQSLHQNEKMKDSELPQILIVEDSSDVRSYLTNLLQADFHIQQAASGEKGLKMATEMFPDLIISDVMMPGMDGMEFCRRIKTDLQTSHIPVILLTAKATIESKLEGLETGADDYLTKPFNYAELSVRVKNLLSQRKLLREKFSREINIQPDAVTVNSLDQDFLKRALDIAEKNLDNTELNSESFARQLFVSRSQLHRKLLAITGQASGEFLRTYRLKRAAQMLLERRLSVTQIAFAVGFNSPSHFTKAFRQNFKCLPSEFIDRKS